MLDTVLSVITGMLTLVLGYMGVHVTLHPATTDREKTYYKVAFGAGALLMCGLIITQGVRSKHSQDALTTALTKIEHNTLTPPQVNNYLPEPKVVFEPAPTPPAKPAISSVPLTYRQVQIKPGIGLQPNPNNPLDKNPGVEVIVTAEREISYPAFEADCDRPCSFTFGQAVNDYTKFNLLESSVNSVSRVEFLVPALLVKGRQIGIDYRSLDDQPIKIKRLRLINTGGNK